MSTICQVEDVSTPKHTDGISYLPTLLGHPDQQKKHPFLYWEFPQYGGQQAVRMGKWKGIRFNMKKGNMKIKLFNLDNDIQEQHDVAGQHPEIVKKIAQIMKEEHQIADVDTFRMKVLDHN